ncbi:hypothetical protein HanHA300_Chr09g0311041 [Helianthus annuus]|nr:hypothetical protein HanHA300_Chr09g0311041 [Helianthus annuus]KAJ0710835.1 hypothetical protein HanOQP8_Chr09g0316991 [Helianthus annuus]
MAPLLKWILFQLLLFLDLSWQLVLDFIIYHDQTTVKEGDCDKRYKF